MSAIFGFLRFGDTGPRLTAARGALLVAPAFEPVMKKYGQ